MHYYVYVVNEFCVCEFCCCCCCMHRLCLPCVPLSHICMCNFWHIHYLCEEIKKKPKSKNVTYFLSEMCVSVFFLSKNTTNNKNHWELQLKHWNNYFAVKVYSLFLFICSFLFPFFIYATEKPIVQRIVCICI